MSAPHHVLPSRSALRWWMLILCLLASGACWWFAKFLVDPQPLWTLEQKGRQYIPLYESEDQLVVVEEALDTGNENGSPFPDISDHVPGWLSILDRRTGKELYRLPVPDICLMLMSSCPYAIPYLDNGMLWRIETVFQDSGRVHQLKCWNYMKENAEKIVHTWKGPNQQPAFIRHNHRVLMSFSQSLAQPFRMISSSIFSSIIVDKLDDGNLFPIVLWTERWDFQPDSRTALSLQSRWVIPDTHSEYQECYSPDGNWAIYTAKWPRDHELARRAKMTGLPNITGKQILELIRPDETDVLVVNTGTGKLASRYQSTSPVIASVGRDSWSGSYFDAHTYERATEKSFLMSEVEKGFYPNFSYLFATSAVLKSQLFQLNNGQIVPVVVTLYNSQLSNTYIYNNKIQCRNKQSMMQLSLQGSQLQILHQIDLPDQDLDSGTSGHSWLLNSGQVITSDQPAKLFWTDLVAKYPWMERVLKLFRKDEQERYQFSVFDNSNGTTREFIFRDQGRWNTPFLTKNLYLNRLEKRDNQILRSKLYSYEVPIRWHSPVWRWLVACLPLVLLMLYVMRRRRSVA